MSLLEELVSQVPVAKGLSSSPRQVWEGTLVLSPCHTESYLMELMHPSIQNCIFVIRFEDVDASDFWLPILHSLDRHLFILTGHVHVSDPVLDDRLIYCNLNLNGRSMPNTELSPHQEALVQQFTETQHFGRYFLGRHLPINDPFQVLLRSHHVYSGQMYFSTWWNPLATLKHQLDVAVNDDSIQRLRIDNCSSSDVLALYSRMYHFVRSRAERTDWYWCPSYEAIAQCVSCYNWVADEQSIGDFALDTVEFRKFVLYIQPKYLRVYQPVIDAFSRCLSRDLVMQIFQWL
jgi:hypothetical protein